MLVAVNVIHAVAVIPLTTRAVSEVHIRVAFVSPAADLAFVPIASKLYFAFSLYGVCLEGSASCCFLSFPKDHICENVSKEKKIIKDRYQRIEGKNAEGNDGCIDKVCGV